MKITAGLYLILNFFALFIPSVLLWGMDSWSYYGPEVSIMLLAAGIVVLIIPEKTNISIFESSVKKIKKIHPVLWLIPSIILFYLFREGTFFLGDGFLKIRNTLMGVEMMPTEPLDTFLHTTLYQLLNPALGLKPQDVFAVVSILCGAGAIYGSYYYLKKFIGRPGRRIFIISAIFLTGSVQLFFGYVESYSTSACMYILFTLSSLYMIREKKYKYSPAVYFSIAVVLHPSAVILLPALAYAYFRISKSKDTTVSLGIVILRTGVIFVGIFALMMIAFLIKGVDIGSYFGTFESGGHLLPLIPTEDSPYAIFSLYHIADLLNELLLIAPAIILIPAAIKFYKEGYNKDEMVFMYLTAGMLLIFMSIFDPALGFARDWDLFSLTAIPLTILITYMLTRDNTYRKFAVPFIIIAMLHTLPWVLLNSDESKSAARAEKIAATPWWKANSRAILYAELYNYYLDRGNDGKAYNLVTDAYNLEKNPKFGFMLAGLNYKMGKYDEAMKYLTELRKIEYEPENVNTLLTEIYLSKGKFAEASDILKEMLKKQPQNPDVLLKYGIAEMNMNNPGAAARAFYKSIKLSPANRKAINYLAKLYFDNKKFAEGLNVFTDLVSKYPENPDINGYMALFCHYTGNSHDAEEYIKKAEKLNINKNILNFLKKQIKENQEH